MEVRITLEKVYATLSFGRIYVFENLVVTNTCCSECLLDSFQRTVTKIIFDAIIWEENQATAEMLVDIRLSRMDIERMIAFAQKSRSGATL